MTTLRTTVFELRRMATSPRWAIVGATCLLAAWLAESSVRVATVNSQLLAHAEDVYLAAVNNVMLLGCLVLPAFVLVVGGTLAADRSSGFVTLSLCRTGRRGRIWVAKVVAVVGGALATQLMLVAGSYAMAILAGDASSRLPSALALVPLSEISVSLFAPALPGDDQVLRVVAAAAFLTLAFAAVGVAALAASVKWPKEFLPPALVLGVVFFDWLIVRFSHIRLYGRMSLSIRLLESSHIATLPEPMRWESSIAYFTVLLVGCLALGLWLFELYDV